MLVYSQDGLGLGHMRRTTLLAAEFLARLPHGNVLTVSDSPAGQFFAAAPGHDYLKLPTIRKAGPGDWRSVSLSMAADELLGIRQEVLRAAAVEFDPDLVLVDHMPLGAMGELLPTINAVRRRGARLVLGLRDILDAPSTVRDRWGTEGALEAVDRHFDRVLVYGSREVFDVGRQYGWPARIASKLRYCGFVCPPVPGRSGASLRQRILRHEPGSRLVVAMAGGGADAGPLFDAVVRAARTISSRRQCVFLIVTGPFMPADKRLELRRLAAGLPIRVVTAVSDATSYMRAADLVVAMAGYNTCAEILSLGVRALLVPRAGPSAEQRMRASLFARRGWVRWLPPADLSPSRLERKILEALQDDVFIASSWPDLGGRQAATSYLLDELARREAAEDGGVVAVPVGALTSLDGHRAATAAE